MADLTILIGERITLNGVDRGIDTNIVIPNINYIDNRILNITGSTITTIFSLDSNPGAGTFVSSSLKYAKVTNKSTTIPLRLIISSSANTMDYLISPNNSFILSTSKVSGSGANNSDFIFNDIISVKVQPSGSFSDVEYFIATT
jgi:hypothetical protein